MSAAPIPQTNEQTFTYLAVASSVFSVLLFFLLSSVADDDTLRFFLSLFFLRVFLSSGSDSELELLVDAEDDELELALDELLADSELELEELLDGVRFFLFPAMNTTSMNVRGSFHK